MLSLLRVNSIVSLSILLIIFSPKQIDSQLLTKLILKYTFFENRLVIWHKIIISVSQTKSKATYFLRKISHFMNILGM